MRPGQNRRLRGRPRSKGPNPLTRAFESNGPDVKIRGTAQHIADKYAQLARDAQASSDPVAAENYLQHAEHYYRLIAAAQEQFRQQYGYQRGDEDGEEGEDDMPSANGFGHPADRNGQGTDEFGDGYPQPGYETRNGGGDRQAQPRYDRGIAGGQDRGQDRGGQDRGEYRQDRVGPDRNGQERGNQRFDRNGERFDRGQDRGGQERGFQDRGNQDRNGQDRNGQDRGGQDRGGQDRGGQDRVNPERVNPERVAQDRQAQDRPTQDRQAQERQPERQPERQERDGGRGDRNNPRFPRADGNGRDGNRNENRRDVARQERQAQPPRAESPRPEARHDEPAEPTGLPAFLTNPVRPPIAISREEPAEPAPLPPVADMDPGIAAEAGAVEDAPVRPRRRRTRRVETVAVESDGESPVE